MRPVTSPAPWLSRAFHVWWLSDPWRVGPFSSRSPLVGGAWTAARPVGVLWGGRRSPSLGGRVLSPGVGSGAGLWPRHRHTASMAPSRFPSALKSGTPHACSSLAPSGPRPRRRSPRGAVVCGRRVWASLRCGWSPVLKESVASNCVTLSVSFRMSGILD